MIDSHFLATMWAHYNWHQSLLVMAAVFALPWLFGFVMRLNPTVRAASKLNKDTLAAKMAKPHYAANQRWNRKWSGLFILIIFGAIVPFCLTADPQPWWRVLRDMVVILMVYDFFYYLTHRFVFHNGGWFDGPLMWMHAVHHRQHNPCRWDSSYIHPLEVAIGLGLYVATIAGLSLVFGSFHVVTVIVTWIAFTEINLHNHDLWTEGRFPFRYANYAAKMHHNHHARFTGGNFATITLLYDWMFGTLDHGDGYPAEVGRRPKKAPAV